MKRVIYGLIVLWLTACSSAPPPRPPLEDNALQWTQRGQDAFRRGEWQEALDAYQEGLRIYASIEQGDGIGVELLNIATVQYAMGDIVAMDKTLDRVLNNVGVPAVHRAEAAYRRAYAKLNAADADGAAAWLEQALQRCAPIDCAALGAMYNLRARLALLRGDTVVADTDARRAAEANRRHGDQIEEANSQRLLADAALRSANGAQALALYEQTLTLDKATAQTRKIVLDLLGAARAAAMLGRTDVVAYLERARSVAESIDDAVLAQQVDATRRELVQK